MNIKVNGRTVEIFSGARVADVLRKYSPLSFKQVQKGSRAVLDARGHELGLNGELRGGEELLVKNVRKREAKP